MDVIQDYWEVSHKNNVLGALSGHSLKRHLQVLRVGIKAHDHVLCIGVGTGEWIKELAKIDSITIAALDISIAALHKVKGIVDIYQYPRELPKECFNWVMSLYVAPHMSSPELQLQLDRVIRSLKKDGMFSIHYLEALIDSDSLDSFCGHRREINEIKAGRVRYRLIHFARMVECGGGSIQQRFVVSEDEARGIRNVVVHISKA